MRKASKKIKQNIKVTFSEVETSEEELTHALPAEDYDDELVEDMDVESVLLYKEHTKPFRLVLVRRCPTLLE